MIERFTCPAGSVLIDYDHTLLVSDVRVFFRGWGSCYQEMAVSSTADAIQRVITRISCEREALPIVEQMRRRIEDLKQGELFAQEG